MRRALIVIGWIATLPGFIGLLGLAVLLTDAEWLFGCRKSGILGITCPQDPLGWFAELLWFGGLALFVWFSRHRDPGGLRAGLSDRQAGDAPKAGGRHHGARRLASGGNLLTSGLTIRAVRTRAVVAPLRQPVTTASGALNDAPLLLIDLTTEQGVTGRAYLLSYQRLALKPLAALVDALGETIVGAAVVPAAIEAGLRARFTLFGGARGLAGLAVSGLDTALWDALAQAADVPLAVLLGARPRPIRAYDSLGMVAAAGAAAQAERSLAAGFTALKIKVGWPTLAEDLAAVRAFRRALPDDVALMVDFNQSLTVAEAVRRARALDGEGLAWIEEPVRCDDFAGCARVAAAVGTPIQIGENFMSVHEMETALTAGACDYVMPDVQQIGGVSGWMRAAALAHARGLECSNHLFIEVSAHLLAAAPTCHYLEYLDVAAAVLADPSRLTGGALCAADRPGTGVAWDEAAVKRYALA